MNLVSFSIKTKGIHNFSRRLWTVCTRFSFSEVRTHQALHTIISSLQKYDPDSLSRISQSLSWMDRRVAPGLHRAWFCL